MKRDYSDFPPGLMVPDAEYDCTVKNSGIDSMPLAMAYVPRQVWRDIYGDDDALMRGTIFGELDLPFKGAGVR